MPLWQRKDVDFYANIDLPNFDYVLFYYRRSKIVWPNEKEDIFVLISSDLLCGSLRFVKRSLYGSLRFRLSVLSDVAFSIQTYKMQLWGIMWPSKFAGWLVWDHLLTETGLLALHVFHDIQRACIDFLPIPSDVFHKMIEIQGPFQLINRRLICAKHRLCFLYRYRSNSAISYHSKSVKQVCLLILAPAQDAILRNHEKLQSFTVRKG